MIARVWRWLKGIPGLVWGLITGIFAIYWGSRLYRRTGKKRPADEAEARKEQVDKVEKAAERTGRVDELADKMAEDDIEGIRRVEDERLADPPSTPEDAAREARESLERAKRWRDGS